MQAIGATGTLAFRWLFSDARAADTKHLAALAGKTSIVVELTMPMGGSEGKFQGVTEQVAIQILEQDSESIPVASHKNFFTITI
jgi:hypothetical protein